MPQIIVAADRGAAFGEGAVTFRETVNVADFESQHFAMQLVERLGWAVEDADHAERVSTSPEHLTGGRESHRKADPRRESHRKADPRCPEAAELRHGERVIVQSPA
jgi:hypothetical protein